MKFQCDCGAKYAFDVTPEMVAQPILFVCPGCGLDSSIRVNDLIRAEFAATAPEISVAPAPATIPPAPPALQVRIHTGGARPTEAPAEMRDTRFCLKHPGVRVTELCRVCEKAICPKCMELFGYVCSPRCKEQAELQGIAVPVFAGQKSRVERERGRLLGRMAAVLAVLGLGFLGAWFWYAWFGSVPKPVFAVRFENDPAYSGAARLCGQDQIVFLHGDTLARYDLKTKKEIWSRALVDKKQIAAQVAVAHQKMREAKDRMERDNPDADIKLPDQGKMTTQMERAAAADLDLRVVGSNVWVAGAGKLVRYDWDTGKPSQEVPLAGGFGSAIAQGDELLLAEANADGQEVITHLSLATGRMRTETIGEPMKSAPAKTNVVVVANKAGGKAAVSPKPSEAEKLAARSQNLSVPGKIALPATLAVGLNQDRALAEMREQDHGKPRPATAPAPDFGEHFEMVPARDGFVQFSVKLLESKVTRHSAVKAPPKKPALSGSLSGLNSGEAANELLNEMQRNQGGDVVYEDQSRYAVTIRVPGEKTVPDWTGEVTGPPELYPLATVNVLAAGKTLIVLDHQNREKWRSMLNFPIVRGSGSLDAANAPNGLGPVVERGDTLYVFDQGVLAAFELATGTARWRLPAVGITSLFFDDAGMIYVNSTTASPESIKYSRQIDITQKVAPVVMKLDPRTGKTLWSTQPGGVISYLSGKFIYTLQSYRPDDSDEDNPYTPDTGLETPPYLRLRRLDPKNGKVLWEHFQQRAPLDVQFDRNSIQLVFKKEVQVLRYLAL